MQILYALTEWENQILLPCRLIETTIARAK